MPTLLSINNYYYRRGGAEVVFLEQNKLFECVGWKIVPFSMQHPNNMETPWSRYFVEEIEFSRKYSPWETLVRASKAVYSTEAQHKITRLVDEVHPDVAHLHNIYHHISPAILKILKRHAIPTVLTLHDLKLACPAYGMYTHDGICERCKGGKLYNVVMHRCMKDSAALSALVFVESVVHRMLGSYAKNVDRFVVPSRFYLKKMVEWGLDIQKFIYIPNFVDVEMLQPDFSVGKAFLYFGRLDIKKGLNTLIQAAKSAQVPLWIAGVGPHEAALRRLAADEVEIEFLGFLSGDALHDVIRAARAVVLPSEWYENAPISVMESYALGKPVIGARIGGIPEMIRDNETGVTFESRSVDELAGMMHSFAQMPDKQLAEMGRAGRSWMEAEFTVSLYRDRMLALYHDLGVKL